MASTSAAPGERAPGGSSLVRRVLWALPLLGLAWVGMTVLGACVEALLPVFETAAKTGFFEDGLRRVRVPVRVRYSGVEGLDQFVGILVAFFTPALAGLGASDGANEMGKLEHGGNLYAPQRLQSLTFLADVATLSGISTIESCRRGNSWTVASTAVIFQILGQLRGGGQIIPLFLFLSYLSSNPARYTKRTARLVPNRYAETLLPALLVGYIIPAIGMFWPTFSLDAKQGWNFVWQFFPIWVLLSHEIFARLVPSSGVEKSRDVSHDLVWLRGAYEFLFLISAATWLYVFFSSPVPLSELFFGGLWEFGKLDPRLITEGVGLFLRWDEALIMSAAAVWMLLSWKDLKAEGRTQATWPWLLVVMGGVGCVCGPGAALAVMAAWREEVLGMPDGKSD